MLRLGQDELAKYPFLADAGEYLQEQGFTLEQFGADPDLRNLVDKALDRVRAAAKEGDYKPDLVDNEVPNDAALIREVFSFLLAIVLLKVSNAHSLVRRFSLSEAMRAEKFLERDLGNMSDESNKQLAVRIIGDLFAVKIEKIDEELVIPVPDYLRHAVHFHEREWKLVNRRVEGGSVYLTPHETVRLIRKELDGYIRSKITKARTPPMIRGLEDAISEVSRMAEKFATPVQFTGEYPPCIKHAIGVLEKGENLPHSGRFMLGTFLLSRGQSIPDIAPLFKNAPDYDEKTTLYQLNNLAGNTGSSTKYSCPSCDKLRTQDLCFATAACDGIINPLQFGRKR